MLDVENTHSRPFDKKNVVVSNSLGSNQTIDQIDALGSSVVCKDTTLPEGNRSGGFRQVGA